MSMKVGDLFVALGLKVDSQSKASLGSFIKGFGSLNTKALGLMAVLSFVGMGLQKIASNANKTGQELFNFGQLTGINTDKMQQWSYFAEKMGAKSGDVETSLKSLQQIIARINMTGEGVAPFAFFNELVGGEDINVTDDLFIILDKLREKLKLTDIATGNMMARQMGMSEGMIISLRATNEEYAKMDKQYKLDREQINTLRDVNKEWKGLSQIVSKTSLLIGAGLAPVTKEALKALTEYAEKYEWMIKNKKSVPIKKMFDLGGVGEWMQKFIKGGDEEVQPFNIEYGDIKKVIGVGGSNETTIHIEVNGSNDPKAVGQEVMDRLIEETTRQTPKDNR